MEQFDLNEDNVRGARTIDKLITEYAEENEQEILTNNVVFDSGTDHELVLYPVMDEFGPVEECEVLEYEINMMDGDVVRVTIHSVYGVSEGVHDGRYGPVVGKFHIVEDQVEN